MGGSDLLVPVEKVLRRTLRRRHHVLLYSAAIVVFMSLTIVACRVLVPQSHLQDRLAIWWTDPRPDLTDSVVSASADAYRYATGRQLLDRKSYDPAGVTLDPSAELQTANSLKREIFSQEAYDVRLQGGAGRRSGVSSRAPAGSTARPPPLFKGHPFEDMSLTLDERVDDLAGRLSLEEVIEQSSSQEGRRTAGVPRLGVRPFTWSTDCTYGRDVNPEATTFPRNLGLAAAFSPDLVRNISNTIAIEMRARFNEQHYEEKSNASRGSAGGSQGLSCFGPTANLMRHPLWSGNKETFGEDPYLTSKMVESYIIGLQGTHPRYMRIAGGCKYMAAHSGPGARSTTHDLTVPERDLQMTYLPPFRACVKSGAQSVVCSTNRVNGVSMCSDRNLLTTIMRNEWGFQGFVASEPYAEVPFDDAAGARLAAVAVRAGANLELRTGETGVYARQKEALQLANLTLEEVRENVKPILRVRMRLGQFDPPTMTPFSDITMTPLQLAKHREQAFIAAMMSFVMLKNDNKTLPIWSGRKYKKVAMIGPFANYTAAGSAGPVSGEEFPTTPLLALGRMGPTAHAPACDAGCRRYNAESVRRAVSGAEIVFVCLGTDEEPQRTNLSLPGKQLQVLQDAVKWKGKAPLVFLLFSGGPVDISWARLAPGVNSILYCFLPGTGTGEAIWRILTRTGRKSSPSARLPFTWPADMSQVPPMTEYSMAGRTYRYVNSVPLFPYGYGLSYSNFNYTSLTISPRLVQPGKDITVNIGVKNVGPFGAEEVVQLYMHWGAVAALAPRLQLVGYRRIYMNVGPEVRVSLVVKAEQMAVWIDKEVHFAILPGEMTLYAGGQQPFQARSLPSNIIKNTFTISR